MKKPYLLYALGLMGLLIVSFALVLGLSAAPSVEAAGPPPRAPRPTPLPTAQVGIRNGDHIVSPNPLVPGQIMTYTFEINNAHGAITARSVVFELPLIGNQEYLNFYTNNSGWALRTPVADRLFVDIGTLVGDQGGVITVTTTCPTNYESPIFRQTVFLRWDDDYQSRQQGTNITSAINQPNYVPITPVPDPSKPVLVGGLPTSGPFAPIADPNVPNNGSAWYFAATKHTLHGQFLNFWLSRSTLIEPQAGLLAIGYPISEEFNDNGRTIQYFERGVMEFWPENPPDYLVLLRTIGRDLDMVMPPIDPKTPAPSQNSIFFGETGHWLDGRFVDTWRDLGGLRQFGFPIGEPVIENNHLIQWTERNRFELDLSRPNQLVLLGLLGRETAQKRGYLPVSQ